MKQRDFWSGFAAGASAVAGGILIASKLSRGGESQVIRLEKSIQIGRPSDQVFDAWSNLEQLGSLTKLVEEVRTDGNHSHWKLNLSGIRVEWDAEMTQLMPKRAIGWKSVKAPKHSGQITFTPLGDDTLLHVQMNYVPPARFLRRMLTPFAGEVEGYIEQALRNFKAGLEGQADDGESTHESARATATYVPLTPRVPTSRVA